MTKNHVSTIFLRSTGVFILQVLRLEIPNVAVCQRNLALVIIMLGLPFQLQYLLQKNKTVYLNCFIVLFFKFKNYFYLFAVSFHTEN